MNEVKFKIWTGTEMLGPFNLTQNPIYWAHEMRDGKILLCTGLKDANGVDIYGGDIVQGHYIEYDPYFAEDNKHEFISDVKYIDNSFKVNRNTVNDEGRIRNYGYLHEWDSQQVKVIGNIYENAELLQEEN